MRKKLLAAGSTVLLVAGLMSIGAGAANAWHSTMSGSAVCNAATGEYTVTYQGDVTSWPDDYSVKATAVAPAGSTVTPADQSFAHEPKFTVTQVVPGTTTSAKVSFAVTWAKDSWSGSQTVTLAGNCEAPTVTPATATVVLTAATCDAAATMTLGDIKNATWPPAVPLITHGPGHYKVTATAEAPATFEHGATTAVFEGDLAGVKDDVSCVTKDATAAASTTAASCGVAGTVVLGATSNATWGTPVYDGLNYTVTATALPKHQFADGQPTMKFTGTLASALPSSDAACVVKDATAVASTTAASCDVTGTLTLGATSNAKWGTPVYTGANYSVVATADPGHVFVDGQATKTFTGTLPTALDSDDPACQLDTHPLVTPVVTSKNLTCDASGSYTLASAEGTDEGIIWTIDGEVVPAGTYPVKTAGSITVTAAPKAPDFGFDFDTQNSWVLNFTDAKDCGNLTTLALTGTDANTINLGLLFAGGLLLLGGALVIAEKRFGFGKK
ncbi:MAG: hypothetical protein ABI275_05485 [Terrimesophilobacter sp.]